MALDFSHICHPSHTESKILSIESSCNGPCHTGLANAWGTNEAKDLSLNGLIQLAHSYEFQYPVLDVLQAIVVFIKNDPGPLEVKVLFTCLPPGHARQPVEVVTGHTELRRMVVEKREFLQLLFDHLLDTLGHFQRFHSLTKLLRNGSLVVLLQSKLLFNELQLFLEKVLPLGLVYLSLHLFP